MSDLEIRNHINRWNEHCSKTKQNEEALIIVAIALMCLGLLIELLFDLVYCGWRLKFESITQVVLQIQGTVTTLSLTVITLISGNIDKSMWGVSITDFYMNKLPWRLTQKRIITIMMVELVANLLFYFTGHYCLVIAIYITGIMFTIYSAITMYSAFKGRRDIDSRILQYILFFFDSDNELERKSELLSCFQKDWLDLIENNQSRVEADRYKDIYIYCCRQLIISAQRERDNELRNCESKGIPIIEQCTENMIKGLLKSEAIQDVFLLIDYLWTFIVI